jgi:hypothetical protein
MASCLVLFVLLFTNFSPALVSTAASLPSNKVKATWLWNTSLISTLDGRNSVLQFAKEQQISRIYLQVNPGTAKSAYGAFIKAASAAGIQIHALDGAPDWIMPEKRQRITDTVNWVKTYNNSVTAQERFTGIQVDIEPYVLPDWNTNREATVTRWLEAITLFATETKKDSVLNTNAALPFWLDEVTVTGNGGGSLIEAMMNQLDEVTLMSYRDQAQALVEITSNKLTLGDRLGKKVFVAVETNPTSEPAYITFYEEGRAKMELELAAVDNSLKVHSSYAGIAVHDYAGWRNLKE